MDNLLFLDNKNQLSTLLGLERSQTILEIITTETLNSNTSKILKIKVRIQNLITLDIEDLKLLIKTTGTKQDQENYSKVAIREAVFYKTVSNNHTTFLPVVKCYLADISEATNEYLIVLQDISDKYTSPENENLIEINIWRNCIESLAKLHAFFWNLSNAKCINHNIKSDNDLEKAAAKDKEMLLEFLSKHDKILSMKQKQIITNAMKINAFLVKEVNNRLKTEDNITIIHGDSHIHNFMIPFSSNEENVLIDFQFWNVSIGAFDIAHLFRVDFPALFANEQLNLVTYYYQALKKFGVKGYSLKQCIDDFRKSVAVMVLIPLWQNLIFDKPYKEWSSALDQLIDNYELLNCKNLLES